SARIHADDLSIMADQHDFRLFGHLRNSGDLAVTLGRLYVDHTRAAASLQAVLIRWRSLSISILSHGKNQRAFDGNCFVGRDFGDLIFGDSSLSFGLL